MTPAELLESARSLIEADPDGHGLVDRVSITSNTLVDGGSAGDTMTPSTTATDVPCLREPFGQKTEVVVGGKAYLVSDRLFMLRTVATLGIVPTSRITMQARDDNPAMVFLEPVIVPEPLSPLVTVVGTLVVQGSLQ